MDNLALDTLTLIYKAIITFLVCTLFAVVYITFFYKEEEDEDNE